MDSFIEVFSQFVVIFVENANVESAINFIQ